MTATLPTPSTSQPSTKAPPNRLLPLAAVVFTLVTWASAFVAIRHLGGHVPAGSLSLGRLLVAVVVLGAMVAISKGRVQLPPRKAWPLIALGGASWIGVYNLTLNAGEQRIDAGTAALLIQVGPILVALLATTFLGEQLTRWVLTGIGVGFVGVVLIGRSSSSGDNGDLLGVALTLVAAFTFAIGVISQKRLLGTGMTALEMTFWFYVVGTIVCLPWTFELAGVVADASAADVGWIVYLGVVPSALAFTTWAYALSHADAGKFAMTTFLVPFITSLMAWPLLDEVPPAMAFVGGVLCIAGVLITRRPARTTDAQPALDVEPVTEPGACTAETVADRD